MELLVGWGLLAGVIFVIWLVVRLAGGEHEEPRASCGLDGGCGSAGKAAGRS